MKKLIPMMAAVACAFGAFAESTGHKETFDSRELGTLELNEPGDYWQGAEGVEASVVEGREGKILDITDSTIKNPLYFNYNQIEGSASAPQAIGKGVYLDTMVQFTISSDLEQKDLGDNVKLAAWAYSNEDDPEAETPSTNLVIRAGYYNNGTLEAKTYTTAKTIDPEKWYRMTVKAMPICTVDSDTYYGFVVYIDKEAVAVLEPVKSGDHEITYFAAAKKYADLNQLLPSAVPGSKTDAESIMGAGFAGTGKIDDVELTDVAPDFAKDDLALTVTLGEGVASVVVKVGDTVVEGEDGVYTLPAGTETVTIEATPATGYVITSEGTCKADAGTFNVTAAKIAATVDGKAYTSLEDALTAAVESGKKLVLQSDVNEAIMMEIAAEATLTIDLAGKTINAVVGDSTIIIDGGVLVIEDSSEGQTGTIEASEGNSAIAASVLTLNGGTVNGGIEAEINFNGGKILDVEYTADMFIVPEDKEAKLGEDGYWTVVNAGPEPEPTYAVTINKADNTTVEKITLNGEEVETLTEAKEGDEIAVTFKADADYELDGEATVTKTVGTEAVTIDGPTATAIEYVTVAAPVTIDNGSYTVDPNGEKVRKGTEVTVTVTPAEEIEVESITINGDAITAVEGVYAKTFTADEDLEFTVVITKVTPPPAQDLPGAEDLPIADKAAYNEWAAATGVTADDTDKANDLAAAYLLGVKDTTTVADALAAAKETVDETLVPQIDMTALANGDLTGAVDAIKLAKGLKATLESVEEIETTASLYRLVITVIPAN